MTFLDWLLPLNLLESYIAQFDIGSQKCVFFFKGIYLSLNLMRQVEIVQMNLRQYQIHKVTSCKIPKPSPRTYIFQSEFLVLLYSALLIFERLNFQM